MINALASPTSRVFTTVALPLITLAATPMINVHRVSIAQAIVCHVILGMCQATSARHPSMQVRSEVLMGCEREG